MSPNVEVPGRQEYVQLYYSSQKYILPSNYPGQNGLTRIVST